MSSNSANIAVSCARKLYCNPYYSYEMLVIPKPAPRFSRGTITIQIPVGHVHCVALRQ